ncbi:MAG TPA: hypothetical protein DDZ81_01190 [Acetobacteraceae bacterium]|jgi:hypothetical protein|nr:hypothetical protein [Acetobacteraceae bacterium]
MTVSLGNLDSLIGMSFPVEDLSGLTIDSFTTLTTPGVLGVDSISVTTNGAAALGTAAGDVLTVVSVNDAYSTLTFDVAGNGTSVQQTDWVIGFEQDHILLSQGGAGLTQVYLQLISGNASSIDAGVLGNEPTPAQTKLTFTVAGTSDITPANTPPLRVIDATNGAVLQATPEPYAGPVAGIQNEYINITRESLAIVAMTPGWFIATGSGLNAIAVTSGTNVLDGGAGSAFMTGGSGPDAFFLDVRSMTSDIWDTVNNFHIGDTMTLWGVTPADFTANWINDQGAPGSRGLTLTVSSSAHPNASVTFANHFADQVSQSDLSVTYGVETASRVPYMIIHTPA